MLIDILSPEFTQFLIPMAVSLGFGVLFATGITLLLVPCGYAILDDVHNLMGLNRKEPVEEVPEHP